MTSYIKGSPIDMAVELVRLRPRRPRELNQALQDHFTITHNEAAGALASAISAGLIDYGFDGYFVLRKGY